MSFRILLSTSIEHAVSTSRVLYALTICDLLTVYEQRSEYVSAGGGVEVFGIGFLDASFYDFLIDRRDRGRPFLVLGRCRHARVFDVDFGRNGSRSGLFDRFDRHGQSAGHEDQDDEYFVESLMRTGRRLVKCSF